MEWTPLQKKNIKLVHLAHYTYQLQLASVACDKETFCDSCYDNVRARMYECKECRHFFGVVSWRAYVALAIWNKDTGRGIIWWVNSLQHESHVDHDNAWSGGICIMNGCMVKGNHACPRCSPNCHFLVLFHFGGKYLQCLIQAMGSIWAPIHTKWLGIWWVCGRALNTYNCDNWRYHKMGGGSHKLA